MVLAGDQHTLRKRQELVVFARQESLDARFLVEPVVKAFAKASVTCFSSVLVSTPIAPVSMPPWPASTAMTKSPGAAFCGAGMALVV